MKRILLIAGILIALGFGLFLMRGNEDSWVRDKRGVWVKHGNPAETPVEVKKQEELLAAAKAEYESIRDDIDFSNGPCLGIIFPNWVLDIVHNPRVKEDNRAQNQCDELNNGQASHYIEMTASGEVIRVR